MLTLATGERYTQMALDLARSLHRHDPSLARAVVTDSDEPALHAHFHTVLRPHGEEVGGMVGKLLIDRLSPFDETLFIDADSLVMRPLDELFGMLEGRDVGVIGEAIREGRWYMDVAAMLARRGLRELPKFNGGVYFVRRGARATEVFATARELAGDYERIGLRLLRGARSDEPLMALALAHHGISAVGDGGRGMATPISMRGRLSVDVLDGRCRFVKCRRPTEPAVVHFAGAWARPRDPRGAFYRRERLKLTLAEAGARAPGLRARLRYAVPCSVGTLLANAGALARAAWEWGR